LPQPSENTAFKKAGFELHIYARKNPTYRNIIFASVVKIFAKGRGNRLASTK